MNNSGRPIGSGRPDEGAQPDEGAEPSTGGETAAEVQLAADVGATADVQPTAAVRAAADAQPAAHARAVADTRAAEGGQPSGGIEPVEGPLVVRELGRVPYAAALELQAELVVQRRANEIPDTLLLLEHPHVITMGTGTEHQNLLVNETERDAMGIELFEAGRGGDITYHGPGQIVGYPIMDLKPDRQDLHRYLRDLEGMIIDVLAEFGVRGRREGLTGVWTPRGKIAALGIRVGSGWITSHGFALNVSTDLSYFGTIVPCGIQDRGVSTLELELGREADHGVVRARLAQATARTFGRVISESEA